MTTLTIDAIASGRLDELAPLWLALHRHHQAIGSHPLVSDETASWQARRAQYAAWLAADEAFILLAARQGRAVGYATVHFHDGPDDTFPVGARWAEIYTLSVAPEARGQGIGSRLLDAIDERLAAMGIDDLAVGTMVENADALRLYERRGFVPREIFLIRFGPAS
jgi:ribosomal protein S18 acetylase RimI-like enzyme